MIDISSSNRSVKPDMSFSPTRFADPREIAASITEAPRSRPIGLLAALSSLVAAVALIPGCASTETAGDDAVTTNTEDIACTETTEITKAAEVPAAPTLPLFTEAISHTALTFDMIPIPGGTVTVQTPDGPQQVEVAPFWILPTEATWEMFDAYHLRLDRTRSAEGTLADAVTRPSKPYLPPDRGFGHAGYAAMSMTHHAAESFCKWLSLKTDRTYRLPTEAEWLHLSKLGGVSAPKIDEYAWHKGNSENQTHPVASRQADALGLYDLYGNVTEWCTDSAGKPVTFGGSYQDPAASLYPPAVIPQTPDWNVSDPQFPKSRWWLADASWVGFRFVCEPE